MGMQGSRGDAGQARAYIIVAQDGATAAPHEPHPVEPRSKGGVVMDEDMAMALLDGGVLAADALVVDLNVRNDILETAADGREPLRQQEARGLLAGECREYELERGRHESRVGLLEKIPSNACKVAREDDQPPAPLGASVPLCRPPHSPPQPWRAFLQYGTHVYTRIICAHGRPKSEGPRCVFCTRACVCVSVLYPARHAVGKVPTRGKVISLLAARSLAEDF